MSQQRSESGTADLLIGTTNRGKIVEISECLAHLPLHIINPIDKGITESPHEDGSTFRENALQKARFYHEKTSLPTLADDSGIIVDALASELGVHTRRWGAGPGATDEEWIACFLDRMKHEDNKRARFECWLAYIDARGKEYFFWGACDGTITETLEAEYLPGLPISGCFRPDGYDCVYSAMSIDQKNSTSHRGKAMTTFRKFIERIYDSRSQHGGEEV